MAATWNKKQVEKCPAILLRVLSRLRETTNTSLPFTFYVKQREAYTVAQKWERASGKRDKWWKIVVTLAARGLL